MFTFLKKTDLSKIDKLTIQIAIALTALSLPYDFIFIFIKQTQLAIILISAQLLFLTAIYLILKKHSKTGKGLLIFSVNISAFFFSLSLKEASGIHTLFFPFTITPLLIFNNNERLPIKIGISLPIICYFFLYFTEFKYLNIYTLDPQIIKIIFYTITPTSFLVLLLCAKYLIEAMQHQITTLEGTLEELKQSQTTNETLAQQSTYARLVKGIAHEIRNPIAGMYTCAELVKEEPDDVEEVTRLCDVVIENLGRLNKLTNAMLKYGGTSTVDQKLFDSTPMIEGMVSIAKAGFQKKGVALLTDLKETSPIYANETFIHSAISNLLANALQYTDTGEVKISSEALSYIDLNGKTRNGIKISVSDSGTGISENDLNNIFDPYFTKKKSETNVGLGLSMAYKFVTESNGKIIVSSKLGEGTTFEVYLPSEAPSTT